VSITDNLSGQDLYEEMQDTRKSTNDAISESIRCGIRKSKSENAYRIAKAQRTLVLREQGFQITILADLVKGTPEVAKLNLEWDIAQVRYDAAKELIWKYRRELDILMTLMRMEYGKIND